MAKTLVMIASKGTDDIVFLSCLGAFHQRLIDGFYLYTQQSHLQSEFDPSVHQSLEASKVFDLPLYLSYMLPLNEFRVAAAALDSLAELIVWTVLLRLDGMLLRFTPRDPARFKKIDIDL